MELHQVVAGDVLDHAAAGLHLVAVVGHEADADDVIAERAVAVAPRAARVERDRAAERRPLGRRARRSAATGLPSPASACSAAMVMPACTVIVMSRAG